MNLVLELKATSISPETDALHNKFLAIHPIDKKIFKVGSKITLEEGFSISYYSFR